MECKAQSSVELIVITAMITLFAAALTVMILNSGQSSIAMAFIKTETLNALSNEEAPNLIHRIDFVENDNPSFKVILSKTPSQEACDKLNEIQEKVKAKFYPNAEVSFKLADNTSVCQ